MLKFIVKTLGIAVCLLLSGAAFAVGMGNINVTSALGEPLKAEIELVSVGKADKGNLSAKLASPDVFKGAGIDYPSGLPKLKFEVETRANGSYYIKLSTAQPVTDPFVNMLVELSWSSGRLLREYTFLLDPPGFKAEEVKIPEIQPILSKTEEPAGMAEEPAQEEMMQSETMDTSILLPHEDAGMSEKSSAMQHPMSHNVASGEIKVKRGDTLSKIAIENKPADVSLERMLVALYRANSDAFDGQNMNRLKTGKILRLPEATDLDEVGHKEAVKEVRAQAVDWNAYRQKLAAASTAAPEQAPKQEVSGKISTSVADKTPPAKEGAKDVVKLSKGEAPGDKAAADKSAQARKQAQEEEATAKAKALKESNDRIALLEKTNKDMQHLLELKKQAAAASAAQPKTEGKTGAALVAPVAESGVSPAPEKTAKPKMAPMVVPPPPSMLDEILSNPLYLAGGAAVLLGLTGFGYMRARGSKGSKPREAAKNKEEPGFTEASMDDTATRISAPVAPSADSGDFTIGAATTTIAAVTESDVDAISEADLFLNFGRDAQAEEILVDAMEKNPANQQVKLKLLSIYANRKDTKSFSGIARQIQESGDAAAWAQAAEMGHKLESNNPMYGAGDESTATTVMEVTAPVEQPKTEEPAGLDFDLGFTAAESAAADDNILDVTQNSEAGSAPSEMDFDLGESEPAAPVDMASTMVLEPTNESPAIDMDSMDFDITGSTPAPVADAAAEASLDDLVLDIPSADESPAEKESSADEGLAFTLDIPSPAAELSPAAQKETEIPGLSDISLDLEVPAATPPAGEEVKDNLWHDVATKLDLARAYQEMGDAAGAREILEEVLRDGDERQRAAAEAMMQQMSV